MMATREMRTGHARLVAAICAILVVAQAILVATTGGGPTRAASIVLAIVVCQVAAMRLPPKRQAATALVATSFAAANFAVHLAAIAPGFPNRLAHAAVLVASGSLLFAAAAALALRLGVVTAIMLALAITAVGVGAEAWLDEGTSGIVRTESGAVPHPLFVRYYPSRAKARTTYPDNPRGYFSEDGGASPWQLALHDARSVATLEERGSALRVAIERATEPVPYNVQLNHPGLKVEAGRTYTLSFRVRASGPRPVFYGLSMAHDPWLGLGFYRQVQAGPEWRDVSESVVLSHSDENARLHFDLGSSAVSVEIDQLSLVRLPGRTVIAPAIIGGTPSISYRFNALGCRGPDYPVPRPANRFRILILGDSHALGEGVHEADTLAASLERALNSGAPPNGIERFDVVNCSVSGYGTRQEQQLYEALGSLYEPNVVVLLMTDNDNAFAIGKEEAGDPEVPGYERLFLTARSVSASIGRWTSRDFAESARALGQLAEATQATNTKLVAVLFRTGASTRAWADLFAAASQAVRGKDVRVLDLGPVMENGHHADELVVHPADKHPNDVAHGIAAAEIERFLNDHALLTSSETRFPSSAGAARPQSPTAPGQAAAAPTLLGQPSFLVIAHRGASSRFPENTLEAISAGFDQGADVVEVDVQLTKDGVPVVFHDETLERTTDGSGRVMDHTVAELKALDAGSWKGAEFANARIATLEEVVQLARNRGPLLLDVKVDGIAGLIAAAYQRAGVSFDQAFVGAWTPAQRLEFVRRMPGARVLKTEGAPANWTDSYFSSLSSAGLWGTEIGDAWPSAFVADARRHGIPVIAYTVNDEPTMRRLIEMGVAGIETDDPGLLRRVLPRPAPQ